MIKTSFLAGYALMIGLTGICQRYQPKKDSLLSELRYTTSIFDSLQKRAHQQDSLVAFLRNKVDSLYYRIDTVNSGYAGWKKALSREAAMFDTTLILLDSAYGVLKRLNKLVDSTARPKK